MPDATPPPPADSLKVALPSVATALPVAAVVERLDGLARQGKMAGFHAGPPKGKAGLGGGPADVAFHVTDFGMPFETVLTAHARPGVGGEQGQTVFDFSMRLRPLMPLVFLVVLITTVWPGVWLTDSLLRVYFPSYGSFLDTRAWATWMWYLPLTVPFVPLSMWTAVKRSRASGYTEAKEIVQRIRDGIKG